VRGKPSKISPSPVRLAVELLGDQADDDLVGDEVAARHHLGHPVAHLGPGGLRRAQHVAGGELDHAPLLDQDARLRALPRPGGPSRMMFIDALSPLVLRPLSRTSR
jgi:hypothetical protein